MHVYDVLTCWQTSKHSRSAIDLWWFMYYVSDVYKFDLNLHIVNKLYIKGIFGFIVCLQMWKEREFIDYMLVLSYRYDSIICTKIRWAVQSLDKVNNYCYSMYRNSGLHMNEPKGYRKYLHLCIYFGGKMKLQNITDFLNLLNCP